MTIEQASCTPEPPMIGSAAHDAIVQCSTSKTSNGGDKRSVHFSKPEEIVFYYNGVTEEERDDVWFRRTDYVEFVEHELRRRELLTAIETTGGDPKGTATANRRSGTGDNDEAVTNATTEAAMKHTFTRRMVSRTFSAGPPRRRRLPCRERNELDVSNHFSKVARAKRQQQKQQEAAASKEQAGERKQEIPDQSSMKQEKVDATTVAKLKEKRAASDESTDAETKVQKEGTLKSTIHREKETGTGGQTSSSSEEVKIEEVDASLDVNTTLNVKDRIQQSPVVETDSKPNHAPAVTV